MSLQEKMVEYRAMTGLSQAGLAKKCKISTQTVCSVENGKQKPSKVTAAKIEMVIGKEEQ